ncbi:8-amino-7-oxononanoate synthase [Thermodesulfobacteriota bacterium]
MRGKRLLNFCSNDYLGLSKHPLLINRSIEFAKLYGVGSTASRMICGTFDCFKEIETKLAEMKGTESALILNSGYQANVSILPALSDGESLILSDWLNHSSIIQGALLSRCRVIRFYHNDLKHLRKLLEENYKKGFSRIFIVTESVFSVDGDQADIDALVALSEEFHAILIVDEAHATGVLGDEGMGLTCGKNVDIAIGTFGKACGSFGAYIACSKMIKDYLINRCTGFIYTTAIPPSVVGSIDAAIELIPKMKKEREYLLKNADMLRSSLNSLGWSTGYSESQIVPVIIGSEENALSVSRYLEENGILAIAIRPPTVEEGQSRIRLAVSALHKEEHLKYFIRVFERFIQHEAKEIPEQNICYRY